MKLRQRPPEEEVRAEDGLYRALLTLKTVDECRRFFHDLCTPAELEALGDRWRVVGLLENGLPYREIHENRLNQHSRPVAKKKAGH